MRYFCAIYHSCSVLRLPVFAPAQHIQLRSREDYALLHSLLYLCIIHCSLPTRQPVRKLEEDGGWCIFFIFFSEVLHTTSRIYFSVYYILTSSHSDGTSLGLSASSAALRADWALLSHLKSPFPALPTPSLLLSTYWIMIDDLWRIYMGMNFGKNSCMWCYNVTFVSSQDLLP